MHRVILLLPILVFPLAAQTDRATLTGTVLDPTQKVVPGARVSVHAVDTGLEVATITNGAGAYTISALPVGQYTASVSMPGFTTLDVSRFTLEVGQTRTLNARLSIASVSTKTTVEVSAAGLDESSAEIGGLIRRSQTQEIPINGRNWSSLLFLIPGAIDSSTGTEQGVRFAGLSQEDNNFHFDGVDATGINHAFQQSTLRLQISMEAIEEFRVNSATYSADQGFTPGGQVEIVSRTGTNAFHGAAYEFIRNNDLLSARPFNATTLPAFHLNNYGANFGGPVRKNKLFFFANYEGLRQILGQPLTALVPTNAYRAQVIQKSPVLGFIVNAFPQGTLPTKDPNVLTYTSFGRQIVSEDSGMFRVDYLVNDHTSAFVRFSTDDSTQPSPSGSLGETSFSNQNMPNGVIDLQHSFSTTILNDAKFGFNRSDNYSGNNGYLPFAVSITGFSSFSSTGAHPEVLNSFSIVDNATFVNGRHTFKAGIEVRRIQSNKGSSFSQTYSYNSETDFINNVVNSDAVSPYMADNGVRKTDYFGYLLDELKVRPNLTVNLGLRYEFFGVPWEVDNRGRAFDPYSCPNLFCAHGEDWYFPNTHDFAPRLGIAWSPNIFHGKTVIRSGWGLFYGEGQLGPIAGAYGNDKQSYTLTQTTAPGLGYPDTPFLGAALYSLSPGGLDRHRKDILINQWSFSIQKEIAPQTTLQVGYFGNEGAHLVQKVNINGVNPATGQRPFANFTSIISYFNTNAVGNFNALQTSVQRSIATGLLISANYQWSHAIDDGSLGGGEFSAPENANCRSCERSSSSQDMRQYFAASAIWKIPVGRGHALLGNASPFWNALLGGWQLSGIGTARAGLPLNVTVSRSASALPDQINSGQRPDCIAGLSLYPAHQTVQSWLSPAAFAIPANGKWGTCSRNLLRAPGLWQMDTAIQKRMPLNERMALSFRAEAFNVFNRAQYGSPSASLPSGNVGPITNAGNYGLITSAFNSTPTGSGTPRDVQLMLRLDF